VKRRRAEKAKARVRARRETMKKGRGTEREEGKCDTRVDWAFSLNNTAKYQQDAQLGYWRSLYFTEGDKAIVLFCAKFGDYGNLTGSQSLGSFITSRDVSEPRNVRSACTERGDATRRRALACTSVECLQRNDGLQKWPYITRMHQPSSSPLASSPHYTRWTSKLRPSISGLSAS